MPLKLLCSVTEIYKSKGNISVPNAVPKISLRIIDKYKSSLKKFRYAYYIKIKAYRLNFKFLILFHF